MQCLPLTSQEKLTYKANHSKAETIYSRVPNILNRLTGFQNNYVKLEPFGVLVSIDIVIFSETTVSSDAYTPNSLSFTSCISIA